MPARQLIARFHAVAGVAAFGTITVFIASSALAELNGDPALIATVKRGVAWALLFLVPALVATRGSGLAMTGGRPPGLAGVKLRRMRLIGANGLLVLVPAALYLAWKVGQGAFDTWFVVVQVVEFGAGAANLALMTLNIRDGLAMTLRRGGRLPAAGQAERCTLISPRQSALRRLGVWTSLIVAHRNQRQLPGEGAGLSRQVRRAGVLLHGFPGRMR